MGLHQGAQVSQMHRNAKTLKSLKITEIIINSIIDSKQYRLELYKLFSNESYLCFTEGLRNEKVSVVPTTKGSLSDTVWLEIVTLGKH